MTASPTSLEPPLFFVPIKVRLKVTAEIKSALEKFPLSPNQTLTPQPNGFIVESEMTVSSELIHWIYASGRDVQVLAPLQLREVVRNSISSALNEYRLV